MNAVRRKQFSEAVKKREAPLGLGRYEHVRSAPAPANGVARPMPSENVRTALVAIPDPLSPKQRLQATVNRAVDVLEMERSHNRIGEAAYRVGRSIQSTYENIREGEGEVNERVDTSLDPDRQMVASLTNAQRRVALHGHLERLVGVIGARFLRSILVEGVTFAEYAARSGKGGERGTAYVADRFRWMLEDVADSWAARG